MAPTFALVCAAAFCLAAGWPATPAGAQEDRLRDRIASERGRERSLAQTVSGLDRELQRATEQLSLLADRVADSSTQLAGARAQARRSRSELATARNRRDRLARRLNSGRALLSAQVVGDYKAERPDIVSLLARSADFGDLISRVEFMRRVQAINRRVLLRVRRDRSAAGRAAAQLRRVNARQRERAQAVATRSAALEQMRAGAAERQATIGATRRARSAALKGTRADRRAAQRQLTRLVAGRAGEVRAARAPTSGRAWSAKPDAPAQRGPATQKPSTAPSSGWAIPWPVVQCESGGQNVPPTRKGGPSGYYQFMPETWQRMGGSTRHAYRAPKAEQDRLAARLWAGGAGASNWTCAAMVGIG